MNFNSKIVCNHSTEFYKNLTAFLSYTSWLSRCERDRCNFSQTSSFSNELKFREKKIEATLGIYRGMHTIFIFFPKCRFITEKTCLEKIAVHSHTHKWLSVFHVTSKHATYFFRAQIFGKFFGARD